jgi:hypothetical protein
MLAQFQSLYPNGGIISELVEIFQGKYVVRVSVQIDGVTRFTGLAAAETPEAAEDQARNRALMVLEMTNSPQTQAELTPQPVTPTQLNPPAITTTGGFEDTTYSPTPEVDLPAIATITEISPPSTSHKNIQSDLFTTDAISTSTNNTYIPDLTPSQSLTTSKQPEFDPPVANGEIPVDNQPENPPFPAIPVSNVTPFTPRSQSSADNPSTQTGTSKRKRKAEPVDLSDIIAKTDVELQRLNWTPEQGREHLIKTYGKRGRTLLTEEELHSFLQYLQSQPDPIAGF